MTDVATDLKDHFWHAELWFLEKWEMYGVNPDGRSIPDVLTDDENKAIEFLKMLHDSVDAIPPSLVGTMKELRSTNPALFERTLGHVVDIVGFRFFPASATEFAEVLNKNLQRNAQSVASA